MKRQAQTGKQSAGPDGFNCRPVRSIYHIDIQGEYNKHTPMHHLYFMDIRNETMGARDAYPN